MRTLAILDSTLPRESVRLDLGLTRAVFLILSGLCLLPATAWNGVAPPIGPIMLQAQFSISGFLVLFLAVRLGGDSVGDARSGLLELLFLTDTSPSDWVKVRLAQTWIGFLSVWICRAPLLIVVVTLGGIAAETILVTELLLVTAFLMLSSLSLVVSCKAGSRRQVYGYVLLGMLFWELLFQAPGIVTGLLKNYYNWPVPTAVLSTAAQIEAIGLSSCFRFAISRPMVLVDCWPTIAVYAGVAGLLAWRFHQLLANHASGETVRPGRPAESGERLPSRVSRRCWDDALAWQAFCIHGRGRQFVMAKCVGVLLLAAGSWYLAERDFAESAFIISIAVTCGMLLISMNKAGDCLAREIREKTLTMLLLTPNGPDDYYAGWQRGAWLLAWPDVLLAVGVTATSFLFDRSAPAVLASVFATLLSSGPFLILSPLVPFSVAGIATGTLLIVVMLVMLFVCVAVGVGISPLAVPIVAIPAVVILNQCLRRLLLPYWISQKIRTVV